MRIAIVILFVLPLTLFQKFLAVIHLECLCQQLELVVRNGIDAGQMGSEHIDLSRFFCGFNQAERFVHSLAPHHKCRA